MTTYEVSVSNFFDADSPEEAVSQMITWLIDDAPFAGYRVTTLNGTTPKPTTFIDADDLDYR